MTYPTTTETCYSTNGEDFNYTELGDALDSLEPGDTLWIGEAVRKPASAYFDVDTMLEQMSEVAYDDAGEHCDDFPDVTKDERAELEKLIGDWLDAKVPVNFWSVEKVRKVVVTQAMLDGTEDVEGSINA